MKQVLQKFLGELKVEEDKFRQLLSEDKLGFALRSAINELDWYLYDLERSAKTTAAQEEQYYLLSLGTARLIRLSLESRAAFDAPTVTFVRRPEVTAAVLELMSGLGFIEHGRRIAHSVATGLCRIDQVGEREFAFTLPTELPDDEFYERAIASHYRQRSRVRMNELLLSKFGKRLGKDVRKMLSNLVRPFMAHFIAYDADLLLDDFFFGIAFSEIQHQDGYDTFHYSTKFGGITFQKYMLALTFFTSISYRHVRFAEALVEKTPTVKLENVLTISSEKSGFVENLKEALDHFGQIYESYEPTTHEEAEQIFHVLSINRTNLDLLAQPGSPLPFAIQCSDSDFIRMNAGVKSRSIEFLLNSLRHNFPREYDRHQQDREAAMQMAMKRVLNGVVPDLQYLENIKVRLAGRELTDIDLVVLEPRTGCVLFCQLKHQDLYGSDLQQKQNRTARLKEQAASWFAATKQWSEAVGPSGVRSTLRLPRSFPPVNAYRLLVSKHYAHPVELIEGETDVARVNWAQLVNAIEQVGEDKPSGASLMDLISTIKLSEPSERQYHDVEPASIWIIDQLKFSVRQEADG